MHFVSTFPKILKCLFLSFSNLRFLMIAFAYAVPTGVIAGWTGVLDMILTPAKVSQVGSAHTLKNTQTMSEMSLLIMLL